MLEPQDPERARQAPEAPPASGDDPGARDGGRRERAEAERLREKFGSRFAAFPDAVECLVKDWDALTAFFHFPKEHWKHLRTSNVVESPFASLRLRTNAAKRFKVVANATVLIWKVLRIAESRWRRLDAPELLKDVYEGRRFVDGKAITRSLEREAA
ncbi:MAG: transposase [Candidatus Limnocylindria bacterium]